MIVHEILRSLMNSRAPAREHFQREPEIDLEYHHVYKASRKKLEESSWSALPRAGRLRPRVAQRDDPVEDGAAGARVLRVGDVEPPALELVAVSWARRGEGRLRAGLR